MARDDLDPVDAGREIALRLLDVRPRTAHELAVALARRQVPAEAAATVLERLAQVGLVDDDAFAAAWVSSRHSGRGLGRRALAAELRRKGIDSATAADAVATIDADDELAVARSLVERRLRSMAGVDGAAKARRLFGMLARKGIAPGVAHRAVREALGLDDAAD
jgi:regulatory protein